MILNIGEDITETVNFYNSTKHIYQQYGFFGYYRGLGLNLVLCLNGFFQMMSY